MQELTNASQAVYKSMEKAPVDGQAAYPPPPQHTHTSYLPGLAPYCHIAHSLRREAMFYQGPIVAHLRFYWPVVCGGECHRLIIRHSWK